jgi:hypothetical protein
MFISKYTVVLESGIHPGFGKNLFRIPDPGVQRHRIPDPAPQHLTEANRVFRRLREAWKQNYKTKKDRRILEIIHVESETGPGPETN